MYQHQWVSGESILMPMGKAVCVGRNYAEHARELGNAVPESPLLFIKPASAWVTMGEHISLPRSDLHFETELALLIGAQLSAEHSENPMAAVTAVTLALDLTDRTQQDVLKEKGHPWERAKAFDGSLPLGAWLPVNQMPENLSDWGYTLELNGKPQQHGRVENMLFSIPDLLAEIVKDFRLEPGDVVLTGTPAGVGKLKSGDKLEFAIDGTEWKQSSQVD
jgi:2-keto-4-pentenoate hydratase/2-oxohepta-3-ene-1,7-dioic acid hydratase in catechol pathway